MPDHTKEINEAGKSSGIFLDGGGINKEEFYSKGTEYVAVDGLGGSYGEQLSWPNTAQMQSSLGVMAKSSAEAELGFGGSSVTANSNIRANAKNRKKIITLPNGDKKEITEYYFPTFGERDPQTGEIKQTGEVILGDTMSGLMTQQNEDGTEETDGYGKEEYDKYLEFTNYMYMSQNGAYAPAEKIASEKREYINKPTDGGIKDDENIGIEYYQAFEDDPVRLWQSKTNDRTAEMVIDEDTGEETNVIKVTRGGKEQTFDLDDPAQKEFFLTEIMVSDPSLKGDSAAAKAKRDAVLANLGIEEEEAVEENNNPIELVDISNLATEFEDISSSMVSIIDSSNVFNRSKNLEKMIDTAVNKLKAIGKEVPRNQIIEALIRMEKEKPDYAKKQKMDGALKYSKENLRVIQLEKLLEE